MESLNAYLFRSSLRCLLAAIALGCATALSSSPRCATGLPQAGSQDPAATQKPAAQPKPQPQQAKRQQGTAALGGDEQRPSNVAQLFRAFAAIKGLSADYTEEKFLSLLAVPLKSKGKLHFIQPGYLSRIVEAPEKSHLTITNAELRMADKDGEQVIDLRQSDRVRLFVTSLVQVFQGNDKALQQHYRVRYTPNAKDALRWQLELVPLKEPLTKIIQRLVLLGSGKTVTRIELHEPNGDRTITTITKVDAKRVFSATEQKAIFGVEAKPAAAAKAKHGSQETPAPKPPGKSK
jgi:outer membrane lipoprotein-sorting protein